MANKKKNQKLINSNFCRAAGDGLNQSDDSPNQPRQIVFMFIHNPHASNHSVNDSNFAVENFENERTPALHGLMTV